ncbi:MAG: DUF58 domain-containing protein [Lachnospiraceae bacterium]|nr:DUF58 domain-containing protein [Lachnospiraceae bacterium]
MNRRNLLILIILFVLALAGISFRGGPVPYIFFFLVLLVPAVCMLYILFVIASVRIYQRSDGRDMVCSRPSDFYITLTNETPISFSAVRIIFYSSFSQVTDIDDGAVYELAPHSSLTRRTRLMCRYRGEYLVGIKELVISDFLGLFSVRYRIKEPLSVIVAPANIKPERLRHGGEHPDADRDSISRRTHPDIPVREYAEGDDAHLIHWKASAASGRLMVRELTGSEKSGIAVIMEAGRHSEKSEEYLPAENRVVETVLALSFYYMQNGVPIDVICRKNTPLRIPVRSPGDHMRLYETMRGYSFGDEDDTLRLFEELSHDLFGSCSIIMPVLIRYGAAEHDGICRINADRVPVRVYLADDAYTADEDIEVVALGTSGRTEDVL